MVQWTANFLSDRSIAVRLDGFLSNRFALKAGVPQGSVLAPILFLIFIINLLNVTSSPIHSYADDSTLHLPIKHSTRSSPSNISNARSLGVTQINNDLNLILQWGEANLVNFNSSKTHCVYISRKNDTDLIPMPTMDNSPVVVEQSLHMLGVTITNSLNWNTHIKTIVRSASRRLGILYRAKRLFSSTQRLTLYKAQVRPLLEYCSHVWGGAALSTLALLDRVQTKAIRFVGDLNLINKLQSLHHRRCVASLSLFYRYYFGKCSAEIASSVPLPLTFARVTRFATFSNSFQVTQPRLRTDAHGSSFFPRTAALWNKLPASAFPHTYNLQTFKKNINQLSI